MTLFSLAGWLGTAVLIISFFLINFKFMKVGIWYEVMNILGALGLALSAIETANFPSLVVQLFWGAIAILALLKMEWFDHHVAHRHHRRMKHSA
ncbi:MAG TPA: hypothetical protein VJB82_02085 [Candidatus Peribacterales bacterium]|nr:hypothetical protein [Candidatus Peribacterales bacterium]